MAEKVTDLDALVGVTEVRDVVYHMVSAERAGSGSDWPELPDEPGDGVDVDEDSDGAPDKAGNNAEAGAEGRGLTVMFRCDDEELGVRCKTFVVCAREDAAAVIGVDVEAIFSLARPVSIPPGIMQEFIQRFGLMVLWPYVRSAVASGAAQLSLTPPPLRLLKPQDVIIPIEGGAEPGAEV
jgi:hypothetical protein